MDQQYADGMRDRHRRAFSDRNTEQGKRLEELENQSAAGTAPTGGDPDIDSYQAKVGGEEAIGGQTPTPDQDNVDAIADAVGVSMDDDEDISIKQTLEERDDQRWQLDPDSAEDH